MDSAGGALPPAPLRRRSTVDAVTQDDVIGTALRIAGEHGLEAVSIRSVAADLGIAPMRIYRFVASKDDLLDAIFVRAMNRMEIPYSRAADWRARVIDVMVAWRNLLEEHPSVLRIAVDRRLPPDSPGLARLADYVIAALEEGGVVGEAAAQTFWQILALTFGHIVFERPRRTIGKAAQAEAGEQMAAVAREHGFTHVEGLAASLTDLNKRGTLESALSVFLNGISNAPRPDSD